MPSISVCIPALNAEPYIGEAIDSVLAQLPRGGEVVVVDDGSTDRTAEVAEAFGSPVRVLRRRWYGVADAFNAAVAESTGEWIAAIDADDRWVAGKLEAQIAAFDADPSLDAVFGQMREFLSPDVPEELRHRWQCRDTPFGFVARGTMLLRRAAWEKHGGLPTNLRVGEFIAWHAHATDHGLRSTTLPQLVLERRIHGANMVLREREGWSDYLSIVKARLDRRRFATEGACGTATEDA